MVKGWAGTYGPEQRVLPDWVGETKGDARRRAMGRLTREEFRDFQRLNNIKFVQVTITPARKRNLR